MSQIDDASSTVNRRSLERTPTTLRGKIFPGTVDCTVKDYNERGARLRFQDTPTVSDRMVVVLWSSGLAFEAMVRWRSRFELGVEFLHSRDLRRPVPAHLAPIRAEWQARRPRFGRRDLNALPTMISTRAARRGAWIP